MPSVLIAGGGLVGSVNACFFGQKGWKVTVFESRPDPRGKSLQPGKSFNLALGCRALDTLERIGLKEKVIEMGVAIREKIRYDGEKEEAVLEKLQGLKEGDFVLTINRQQLSELLINEAENYNNVEFLFNHKATKIDAASQKLHIEKSDGSSLTVDGDLILACDGAHSSIRRSLLKVPGFDFNQKYCEIGYMDLSAEVQNMDGFKLGVHYSWRKEGVILVALANRNGILTVSMFARFEVFERIQEDPVGFFAANFAPVHSTIGGAHILATITKNKPQAIISLQCSQHGFFDKLLLMGDAAHAMVPFQGQGANCGFEDCVVLQEILEEYEDVKDVVREYSKLRTMDTNVMNQMEWEGYLQLFQLLKHPKQSSGWFLAFTSSLKSHFPGFFPSTFTRAMFSRERYSEIAKRNKKNRKFINTTVKIILIFGIPLIFAIIIFEF